ncbi:unnamed protein product, partial [Heterosigma akashiwo]
MASRLFGKKKKPAEPAKPAPTLTDATGRLDAREQKLDQTIKKLDGELRQFKEQLKKAKGPTAARLKKRAMETLKRKRMYEQQRDQLAGQKFNIEQTGFALDSVQDTAATVAALKEAKGALAQQVAQLDIDKVDDVVDDLAEAMGEIEEINEALGTAYGTPEDLDEGDLEAELAILEDELEEEVGEAEATPEYLQPAAPAALPSAPT